jgi:hypothetical protein
LVFSITLIACTEKTQVNTVRGTLFNNCNSRLPYNEVVLKANIGESFGDPIILASGISNQDGGFDLSYELEEEDKGTAAVLLLSDNGYMTLLEEMKLNQDQELVLYKNLEQLSIVVQLAGTKVWNSGDTLFLGAHPAGPESFVVQPTNGVIDTLIYPTYNTRSGTNTITLYYGVGSADFRKSEEELFIADSTYQHIEFTSAVCAGDNVVSVIIDK